MLRRRRGCSIRRGGTSDSVEEALKRRAVRERSIAARLRIKNQELSARSSVPEAQCLKLSA